MNTRSCLPAIGVSALLATGSVLTAAPASAAPGSAECISAQSAFGAQLGAATVDITIANQLRSAITELETVGAQLEALYPRLDAALAVEIAAADEAESAWNTADGALADADLELTAAVTDLADANERLRRAIVALEADPEDLAAIAERDAAQIGADEALLAQETAADNVVTAEANVEAALLEAERTGIALDAAFNAAYRSLGIEALELRANDAIVDLEALLTTLGLTEGTDPEQLVALANAVVAACSAPAVAHTPAIRAVAPQQRGLNIQTAAYDTGATDPANLALLAGLAGFGAAAATGAVVVVRRRNAERA